ncbi:MAG: Asp-tRNA(Asn)/Glu-tRNA(Gln) amidotransferase subunit GatC [Crocinitomicaceae bacterium]|nr:Asp-tRNA(Asn)/Glu-tRNA(Gln) amidotransferase subunit GatC [Crocinitomicaceae bacterium]
MQITDEIIDQIAELAKLKFEGEQKEAIKGDLSNIVQFMDKLSEVDTDGVEPLISMVEDENDMREDVIGNEVSKEEALKNAPSKNSDYFKIPKVLDKTGE